MAENPLLSKLTVGSVTYELKDAQARTDIAAIQAAIAGGTHFLGITQTAIHDGDTATAITIVGKTEPVTPVAGDIVISKPSADHLGYEFICANGKWFELGSSGALKALAFKDSAEGTYTPEGSVTTADQTVTGTITTNVSANAVTGVTASFVGKEGDISAEFTPAGTISGTVSGTTTAQIPAYTPAGTITGTVTGTATVTMADYKPEGEVSKPDITVTEAKSSALVGATYTEATETLAFTDSQFLTGATAALDEAPTFTGTDKAPTVSSATTTATLNQSDNKLTFAGTEKAATALNGTCQTVLDQSDNKLTFAGSDGTATGKFTPEATSVTVANFTPTLVNGTVTHTLTAPGQTVELDGTEATITVQ